MKFRVTDRARADIKRLSADERRMFEKAVRRFNEACDHRVQNPGAGWPRSLRVRDVEGAPGVLELTWSFSGPDGRATWEWGEQERTEGGRVVRETIVVWRRVGGHEVFRDP